MSIIIPTSLIGLRTLFRRSLFTLKSSKGNVIDLWFVEQMQKHLGKVEAVVVEEKEYESFMSVSRDLRDEALRELKTRLRNFYTNLKSTSRFDEDMEDVKDYYKCLEDLDSMEGVDLIIEVKRVKTLMETHPEGMLRPKFIDPELFGAYVTQAESNLAIANSALAEHGDRMNRTVTVRGQAYEFTKDFVAHVRYQFRKRPGPWVRQYCRALGFRFETKVGSTDIFDVGDEQDGVDPTDVITEPPIDETETPDGTATSTDGDGPVTSTTDNADTVAPEATPDLPSNNGRDKIANA